MKSIAHIEEAKTWISNHVIIRLHLKLVVGMALGALFSTVVFGFPFGNTDVLDPNNSVADASVSGSSQVQQPADHQIPAQQDISKALESGTPSRAAVKEFFGEDVVDTLGYEVLTVRLSQYEADGHLSNRDMENLDHEIAMLLAAAADKSSGTLTNTATTGRLSA